MIYTQKRSELSQGLSVLQSVILGSEDLHKSRFDNLKLDENNVNSENILKTHAQKILHPTSKALKEINKNSKLNEKDLHTLKAMFACHKDMSTGELDIQAYRLSKTSLNKQDLLVTTDVQYSLKSSGYQELLDKELIKESDKLLKDIFESENCIQQIYIENKLYNSNDMNVSDLDPKVKCALSKIIYSTLRNSLESETLVKDLPLNQVYEDSYNSLKECKSAYQVFGPSLPLFVLMLVKKGDKSLLSLCKKLKKSAFYSTKFNENKNRILEEESSVRPVDTSNNNQQLSEAQIVKNNSEAAVKSEEGKEGKKSVLKKLHNRISQRSNKNKNKNSVLEKAINSNTDVAKDKALEDVSTGIGSDLNISNLLSKLTQASLIIHAD